MRVAAIDCGTNSVRLLVADHDDGHLTDVARRMEIVRLGQGVDRTGRLAPEAIERTRVALVGYADEIFGPAGGPDPDGRHERDRERPTARISSPWSAPRWASPPRWSPLRGGATVLHRRRQGLPAGTHAVPRR